MQTKKKPTNAQYEKLLLKIQSKLFGLTDKEVLKFDEILENGDPFNFFKSAKLCKIVFISDLGVTLQQTDAHALVMRNFCVTTFNSNTENNISSPYVLIGMVIDIFNKYECTTFTDLVQNENKLEKSERIIIDCFIMWIHALTAPQFECAINGETQREHINGYTRLQLLFDCAIKCNEVFLANEKDLTLYEYYNEFIKMMRIKSFTYNNIDNSEEIIKIEDEAFEKIKERIVENGNELSPYIAMIAPKFEDTKKEDEILETSTP